MAEHNFSLDIFLNIFPVRNFLLLWKLIKLALIYYYLYDADTQKNIAEIKGKFEI